MALTRMFQPFLEWATVRYQARLATNLKEYGLRYDDLYDPMMDMDVAEALRRLPEDVVVARNCRLKRAMDLSMKGIKLPYDLQEKQTPFEYYLQDMLGQVKAEKRERAQLGSGAPYQRTIP
jgi:ubiquinol-cytochrome c reductase subunit 7